ncbi:hypothetical protein KMT30_26990 [Streptomyces sp. IBSBF 2953]|uniref:condensation domain-containing protein n=1 Tax=Streptomyces hayashii TaxID=2839966 RepID=UPI002119F266|nr:hypothetical protein [Streptomyces hayashii]
MERADIRAVPFSAKRSGIYPQTWGQQWMWEEVVTCGPDLHHLNITKLVPVTGALTTEDVCQVLRTLVERHEVLRTTFRLGGAGEPQQVVVDHGQLFVDIYDIGRGNEECLDGLIARLDDFRFAAEDVFPIKFCLVVRNGRPEAVVFGLFHLAADGWSLPLLFAELKDMLGSPGAPRASAAPGGLITQPADLALREGQSEGRERTARSLRYWMVKLPECPPAMLPDQRRVPESHRFQNLIMKSPAMSAANEVIAARHKVSHQTVTLSLAALVLAAWSGNPRSGFTLYSANRTRGLSHPSLGTLVQDVPICLDVDRATFPQVLRSAWAAALPAYRCGRYDPAAVKTAVREMRTLGRCEADLSCTLNLGMAQSNPSSPQRPPGPLSKDPADLLRLTTVSTLRGLDRDRPGRRFYLTVDYFPDETWIKLRADTAVISPDDMKSFLHALESLAVQAAVDGTANTEVAGKILDAYPPNRW